MRAVYWKDLDHENSRRALALKIEEPSKPVVLILRNEQKVYEATMVVF